MVARWMVALALLAAPFTLPVGATAQATERPAPPAEIDLLRPSEGFPRIFVQARFPDGSLGLFLVDTGADISVMHRSTAERLGLDIREGASTAEGLSGKVQIGLTRLPTLDLGERSVADVDFAVDVRGLTDTAGMMPLDGLLGNNVWSRFVVELDYPANLMVLHEPGSVKLPRNQEVLFFDGHHIYSPVTLTTDSRPPATHTLIAQVDTGAGQILLCAATGLPFQGAYTEGLEELRGIGASETLPPYRFLETTRRIPIARAQLGGATYPVDVHARWVAFDDLHTDRCMGGIRALLGHEFLSEHRVFFDYQGARMSLSRSRRPARFVDGHEVMLEQDRAAHGDDPDRATLRAKLKVGSGDLQGARALLNQAVAEPSADHALRAEQRVWLARLNRELGDLDASWQAIQHLSPEELVAQEEIVATVNGLIFAGRVAEARELADQAVEAAPEDGWARVARADVLLFQGEPRAARDELQRAARIEGFPDAHLLRRARVALAEGDRHGAMAHIRRLLQLYPFGGEFLWFYALLIEPEDASTFRADMEHAMSRLHPHRLPLDFLVAAHHALGEQEQALDRMRQGLDRYCDPLDTQDAKDNCVAWFYALAHHNLDDALRRIERALNKTGPRSDYLDTRAMVHLAREELPEAFASAWEAARRSPGDVYMGWQTERIGAALEAQGKSPLGQVPAAPGGLADGQPAAPPLDRAGPARDNDPEPDDPSPGSP